MAKKTFTKKQLRIFEFIRSYQIKNQISPTLQEIADHFQVRITNISEYIKRMAERGQVTFDPHKLRSLDIPEKEDNYVLKKDDRGMLVFDTGALQIPVSDFIGYTFKIIS